MVAPASMAALHHLDQEVELGAGRVLGRELDVVELLARHLHALDGPADDLLLGHLELEVAVDGAGGQEDVAAPARRVLERLPRGGDVALVAAREAGDDRPLDLRGSPPGWPRSRPGEAAAKPASITSTPRSRRARATWSFCSRFMEAPGDCSPSRRVVSKMTMRSDAAWLTLLPPSTTVMLGFWLPGCFDMSGPRAPGVGPKRVARLSRATSSAGSAEEVAAQRHPGRDTSPAGLRSRRVLLAKFMSRKR